MPFIVDDILPSFDDERARATMQLLAEVSEHFQVIFLTHRYLFHPTRRLLAG